MHCYIIIEKKPKRYIPHSICTDGWTDERTYGSVCVQVRKTIQLQWLCTGRNTPDSSSHVFIDRRVVTFRIMIYEYYPTHLFSLFRQTKRTEQKTKQNKKTLHQQLQMHMPKYKKSKLTNEWMNEIQHFRQHIFINYIIHVHIKRQCLCSNLFLAVYIVQS